MVLKSTTLRRILGQLRKRYETEKSKFLVVPYVLACSAYLESRLNDSLSDLTGKRYGGEVAEAFMSLSLPKKLAVLVPILTDGRYEINKNHFVYQRLASLIRTRNTIAHAKSELEVISVGEEDLVEVPFIDGGMGGMLRKPRQFVGNEPDVTLGATKTFTPLEYHDALDKLEKWFFDRCPDRLSKLAMVVDRSKGGTWKSVGYTYVKYLDDDDDSERQRRRKSPG
jgi:hypothetical protein